MKNNQYPQGLNIDSRHHEKHQNNDPGTRNTEQNKLGKKWKETKQKWKEEIETNIRRIQRKFCTEK